jgi:tripartite-type tricarboxylate transporter receptor subunit TctC
MEMAADKDDHTKNVLRLIFATQKIERPFFGPPGMPAAAVHDLRTAFEATMKNPAFLAEAKKLKLELAFVSGEDVKDSIDWAYTMPSDVLEDAGGGE